MDPITIGLAIAGAKKLLETATDIKDIAGSIEQLFSHTEKAEKNKGVAKQGEGDTSIASVVTDVIEERNNATRLRNLEIDIDNKFGAGTWAAIKTERQLRLDAVEVDKVKAAKRRKAKQQESDEFYKKCFYWLGEFFKLMAILALAGGAGYIIYINRCVEGSC
tara:strand:- start:1534 stop:2022 length:489 start_codon:yes stop_codon:yes gene_type:complete